MLKKFLLIACAAGLLTPSIGLAAQASQGSYRCWSQQFYGRTDGWCLDASTYDLHYFVNGTSVYEVEAAGDTMTLVNGAQIDNATNGAITFTEASEDLILTFTSNDVAVSTSTGVLEIDFGTITLETAAVHANAAGTLSLAGIGATAEDMVFTGAANLLTLSSSTSATFAITPAISLTGIATPVGGVANAGGTTKVVAYPGSVHTGGVPATATAEGDDATPVNTEIYYSEIFVPCNMTVTGISHFNGSNVGTDARHSALLDIDGALVTGSATGADATSGADTYEKQAFTGGAITIVGPATYFVATIYAASTGRYNAHGTATTALGFSTNMIAGKITGQTYGAIPASNSLTYTYTTDLGPIASLY